MYRKINFYACVLLGFHVLEMYHGANSFTKSNLFDFLDFINQYVHGKKDVHLAFKMAFNLMYVTY